MEISIDGGKVITAHVNGFTIKTDQPINNGGTNTAPNPFELFLASLGTCAGIFIKSFCDNREIPAEGITITESYVTNKETGLPESITLKVNLPADFPEKYKKSVLLAAEQCKVKRTILAQPPIEVTL